MTGFTPGRRVYIARHGQTSDNLIDKASGRNDRPHLTHQGIASAMGLQGLLVQLDPPVTHMTSSSLERAMNTKHLATQMLSAKEIPPMSDFDERDYEIDGVVKDNLESQEAHQERVVHGINKLLEDPDCVPLVFCHAGTIRRVIDAIGNFHHSPDYITIPNASVIELVTPSSETAHDWQLNVITNGKNGVERRPLALNAEQHRRKDGEPRYYKA